MQMIPFVLRLLFCRLIMTMTDVFFGLCSAIVLGNIVIHEVPHTNYIKKKVKKYSLGMRQKLGIAMAILDDPNIIILDEPFNALDKKSVSNVKDIILGLKADNKLVILSSHDGVLLEEVTDKIYEIEEGKIVGGKN